MFEVIPGILEKGWDQIEQKIELILPFAKTVHIDIVDGKFAPNTTFLDPKPFAKYKDKIFLELHLMVDNPVEYLKPWADAGFKRFIGQIEKMPDQVEFVAQGQLLGEVGLAIDGPTSPEELKIPLEDLDTVLVMTIKAGFSGQSFNPEYLKKIREILKQVQNDKVSIEVDGGINDQTIKLARDAGANRFSATSFIYKEDPKTQFQKLNSLIHDY
ncbi:MAG: hypothetical protein Q8P80_02145 [Candidatus Levybacteria bacterium]|nr:hypothetical protein [Candidatus Levybacteria bacterium]